MLPKPEGCKECPLFGDGRGFVPDRVVEGAEVLYLAQNPGPDEEAGRKLVQYVGKKDRVYENVTPQPLIGPTGYSLAREFLPHAGLSPETTSYANLLRCRDGYRAKDGTWKKTNDMPKGERLTAAIGCCEKYLSIPASTKLIVTAGVYSWEWTQGKGFPLATWRGYCGPSLVSGLPVFATLHPASLFRSPKMKGATKKDFQRVRAVLQGRWPVEMPLGRVVPQEVGVEEAQAVLHQAVQAGVSQFLIDTEYVWREDDVLGHHPLTVVGIIWRNPDRTFGVVQYDWRVMTEAQKLTAMGDVAWLCRHQTTIMQNAAADMPVLEWNGGLPREQYARVEDLLLLHAASWPEQPHDLAFLKSVLGVLRWPKAYMWAGGDLIEYNRSDLVDSLVVWECVEREARPDTGVYQTTYRDQLIPLLPIHTRATEEGIAVNKAVVLPALEGELAKMQEAIKLARAYVGFPLNLGSQEQVSRVLYTYLGLKTKTNKKTKHVTINDDAIAELRKTYLPFDAEEEAREGLSIEHAVTRIEQGAHPVLEARVVYAGALQTIGHYLAPLVRV